MSFEAPFVLHLFSPTPHASPFDVNMAADAGWQMIVPYPNVGLDMVRAMTQDAIFSRGPKGVRRTGIFVGGRDALVAADMVDAARAAMVKPFVVSVMADPSGGYTTAAAMVACVEDGLKRHGGAGLEGRQVLVLGGTGPVGRIAGAMAAQAGAQVALASHRDAATAQAAADETARRFGVAMRGVHASGGAVLRDADVVLACAAAGVQVASAADLAAAQRPRVLADVNAVPPEGLAGVGVFDDGVPVAGTQAVGYGALAIGNVKYQTQHRLLKAMLESDTPLALGFAEAFSMAREVVAGNRARQAAKKAASGAAS